MTRSFGTGNALDFFAFVAFSAANRCTLRRKMLWRLHIGDQAPIYPTVRDLACLAVARRGRRQEHQNPDTRTRKWLRGHLTRFRVFQETTMASGTVKFFNGQKGFGFIAQDGGGPDV